MPRQGEGHIAHNSSELTGGEIAHGVPQDPKIENSAVDRSGKAAEMPEHEEGAHIPGMPASAGHSQGLSMSEERGQGGRHS